MPSTEPPDHVGVLAGVIASQAETIKSQAQTIDTLSGGRAKTLALEQTIGDMWQRHFDGLPDVRWKLSVRSMMKRFLAACGTVKVGDFGPLDWERWRDAPETRASLGPTSLNICLTRLRILFAWAINTDQLVEDPLRRVKPLRGPAKRTTEVSEEDERLIAKDMDPVMRALYITAVDSTMRREEARLLRWDEIDFTNRTIVLAAHRTKGRRARIVYLTTRAVALLKALPKVPGCPFVFANPETKLAYSKTHVWYRFRKAADENGIEPAPGDRSVRFHDATRRTGACRLVRLGASLPAVQQILGHADMATTFTYVSAQRHDVIAAHALLEKATRKGPMRAPGSAGAGSSANRKRASST